MFGHKKKKVKAILDVTFSRAAGVQAQKTRTDRHTIIGGGKENEGNSEGSLQIKLTQRLQIRSVSN